MQLRNVEVGGQNREASELRPRPSVEATACDILAVNENIFIGKWCYLYRAIDRDGNLVDSLLSEKRDMEAAKRFDLRKPPMW